MAPMKLSAELGVDPYHWRNGIDTRIRAASMLVMAALDDLHQVDTETAADEIRRRELEWLVRGLMHATRELALRIVELRKPIAPEACAHCGWHRPPRNELCPRCSRLLGVAREPADRRRARKPDPVRFARELRERAQAGEALVGGRKKLLRL